MSIDLQSNPNFYDYKHQIILESNGQCRFIDYAGQRVNIDLTGTYLLSFDDDNHVLGSLEFKVNDKDFKVNFRILNNLTVMRNEIVWKSSLDDWPFSVFNKNYIFDIDPFIELYKNRDYNLYFIIEGDKETNDSLKCFYPYTNDCCKKASELTNIELDIVKNTYTEFYDAFTNQ